MKHTHYKAGKDTSSQILRDCFINKHYLEKVYVKRLYITLLVLVANAVFCCPKLELIFPQPAREWSNFFLFLRVGFKSTICSYIYLCFFFNIMDVITIRFILKMYEPDFVYIAIFGVGDVFSCSALCVNYI